MKFYLINIFRLVFIGCLAVLSGAANVTERNGNFFVGYSDIVYSGGLEPKIERVYNSKTPFKGMFGWGWGSMYEARLTISVDGNLQITEYGGGSSQVYFGKLLDAARRAEIIENIVRAAREKNELKNTIQITEYRSKLQTNGEFRNDEWQRFIKLKLIAAPPIEVGSTFLFDSDAKQIIKKVRGGFVRDKKDGLIEQFNDAGFLTRISDKNSNFIGFNRDQNNTLINLKDNFQRQIAFTFNARGLLEKIVGDKGKQAVYQYNENDELVRSQDVDQNVYEYEYDRTGYHNLTKISYSDKTAMTMDYWGKDKYQNIRRVVERDGSSAIYDYTYFQDKTRFKIERNEFDAGNKRTKQRSIEYFFKTDAAGRELTVRLVVTENGRREEIVNNDFSQPISITKPDGKILRLQYDARGFVVRRDEGATITHLKYHPRANRVSQLIETAPPHAAAQKSFNFDYDVAGRLTIAEGAPGKSYSLEYDAAGRIARVAAPEQISLDIAYHETGFPLEFRLTERAKLHRLKIVYDKDFKVIKLENLDGADIAAKILKLFEDLSAPINAASAATDVNSVLPEEAQCGCLESNNAPTMHSATHNLFYALYQIDNQINPKKDNAAAQK